MHNRNDQVFKTQLATASWHTLEQAHPELARLLRMHGHDAVLFTTIDDLLNVQTIDEFTLKANQLAQSYPDFKSHLKSITSSNEDTWARFQVHRELARSVFQSLKP